MWRDVARFEAQLQRREFLTSVYVAVFFFLTFGYTSSSAVELVSERGEVARNAPWALAHAMAGVTAFGQVITTMITATAVMRDVATRQQELLFTTRLSRNDYLLGRWAGALAIMLAVYAAIPAGLLTGSVMPWVAEGTLQPFHAGAYVRPLAVLVLPNVLVVSALFFAAGAMGRSFMTILLLGVGLVVLWGTGVSLARDGVVAGAWLDPFGNAALEWVTRDWSAGERTTRLLPVSGELLANRALWLALGGAAFGWLLARFRFEVVAATGRASRQVHNESPPGQMEAAGQRTTPGQALWHEARWIFRWTLRERGFLTLASLGALNALVNAWRAGGASPTAADVLGAVQEHSRVFLILVATIYAGELVWRERDVRVDALRDVVPQATGTLVAGRIAGILAAELALVTPLLIVGLLSGYGRGAEGMGVGLSFVWIFGLVYAFVGQLTLVSLAVHAVLQHKVAAHVALIIGWLGAVALDRTLTLPWWVRVAGVPEFGWTVANGFGGVGGVIAGVVAYWWGVGALCGVVAAVVWVRGVGRMGRVRSPR